MTDRIARRRAASMKGWRTRKRMKAARSQLERVGETVPLDGLLESQFKLAEQVGKDFMHFMHCIDLHQNWPAYMKRVLPCPDFGGSHG